MWLSPSLLLMILSVTSSVLLVASSSSLFISWVGLELNTLAFIPLLLSKKNKLTSEASIKYFLTQTLASILVIGGGLLFFISRVGEGEGLIFFGLAIKLGAAPFHSWLVTVAESLGWAPLFILLTVQKINPLLMVWNFSSVNLDLLFFIIVTTLIVGALMGLIQTSARALLTFSSINHVGWLLTSTIYSLQAMLIYFFIYSTILLAPILLLHLNNISHLNELPLIQLKMQHQCLLFFCFLSLGGLPPFLGFLPKWMILQFTASFSLGMLSLTLISTSLFTLFFYLRLMFAAFIFGGGGVYQNTSLKIPFFLSFLLSISVGGLFTAYFL